METMRMYLRTNFFVGGLYSFMDWKISIKRMKIPELGTSGIIISTFPKMEYEIDMNGIVLPDSNDIGSVDFLTKSGEKLVFTKKPSDSQINDFCNLVRKKSKGDRGKEQKYFGDLKKKITESFIGYKEKENNVLLIPLSFKFADSSTLMQKCIEEVDKRISEIIRKNSISAYYYLTPFRPTDYAEKDSYAQLSNVLRYGYADSANKHNKKEPFRGVLPITVNDINSYRRLTKIILNQMIEVDIQHKYCPNCGEKMSARGNAHYCHSCDLQIFTTKCNKCEESFKFTKYRMPKMSIVVGDTVNLKMLIKESSEGFKNITDLDVCGNPICPYCGNPQ